MHNGKKVQNKKKCGQWGREKFCCTKHREIIKDKKNGIILPGKTFLIQGHGERENVKILAIIMPGNAFLGSRPQGK